ncbi:hypothetical protein BIW11_14181 [Tropilaelaps mercedesae]|uniref:Uncharacterized protein n=1 Tax=Tropilaelaps mercedesae TaxID=418985 RepID=A0A1V9WYW0_9ACAR|nr:hypothetical protein BIW11_14181 [Tropilaelaps mercedesae]
MSGLDASRATKRPRIEVSDDSDDDIWSFAIEQDEAIQSQRFTQRLMDPAASRTAFSQHDTQQSTNEHYCADLLNTQTSPMSPQGAVLRRNQSAPESKSAIPAFAVLNGLPQASLVSYDVDQKTKNLLNELRKKSSEKLALQRELNMLKAKQANFCINNCKKQLDILNDNVRFKQKEIDAQHRRIKELEARRVNDPRKALRTEESAPVYAAPVPIPNVSSLFASDAAKKPFKFPALIFEALPDLEVFEDFAQADPSDTFACKHFAKWCRQHIRAAEATEGYIDRLRQSLPSVFDKVVASQDPSVSVAFLRFLAHVQDVTRVSVTPCIDWRQLLTQAGRNVPLLLALTRFLSRSLGGVTLYPTLFATISDEANWRHCDFHQLLNAILEMVQDRPESCESFAIVKQVLRVYRDVLEVNTDPNNVEQMLVRALMLQLGGAPIELELVAVVTRGEAFYHLGDVLKKIIRCQPTLSNTGCPEMMQIAGESFRDG